MGLPQWHVGKWVGTGPGSSRSPGGEDDTSEGTLMKAWVDPGPEHTQDSIPVSPE